MLRSLCRAPPFCWRRSASSKPRPLSSFTSDPAFEHERTKPLLQTAQQEAEALKTAESSLGTEFDLTLAGGMHTPAQLLECAAVLDQASLWQRLFGRDYREAVKVYRRIARGAKKASRTDMSRALRSVAEYITGASSLTTMPLTARCLEFISRACPAHGTIWTRYSSGTSRFL